MKKLVIRQSNSRHSHVPSELYVDTILAKNVKSNYKMKAKGKDTLSITFDDHIDSQTCKTLAKKLGLDISSMSDQRCVLVFPY